MRKWMRRPFLSLGLRVGTVEVWALGVILSLTPIPRSRGPGVLTPFPVRAPGGQLLWEILQPYALFPGSNPTSGAAQSKLNANVCLCPWNMSFPFPPQLFFVSNGFSTNLFRARMFLGASESISAVVKAVEFQEQQELLAVDVVTQYTLLCPLWGL